MCAATAASNHGGLPCGPYASTLVDPNGEASGNQAAPIKTWYELGSQSGHEFK